LTPVAFVAGEARWRFPANTSFTKAGAIDRRQMPGALVRADTGSSNRRRFERESWPLIAKAEFGR
jgi:hypothetical protein